MSQWAAFAKLKAPFHLYVPAAMVDVARRFCTDLQIDVTEIWAYHTIGDQIRFTAIQRAPGSDDGVPVREPRRPKVTEPVKPVRVAKPPARPAVKVAVKTVAPKPPRRPAAPVRKTARAASSAKPAARAAAKKAPTRTAKRK
jgi:hypothetical protein